MNKFFILLIAGLLAACQSGPDLADLGKAPLAGARMGGDFALTSQDGKPMRAADLRGKFWLVYFGYTFCPDVCPVDVQIIGRAVKQIEKDAPQLGAKLVPVFITGDPARDDPASLKQFLGNFHPRFIGLTGSVAQIDKVASDYGMAIVRDPPAKDGSYLVNHPRYATLYGPEGQPLAFIPVDRGVEASVAELRRWLR